MSRIMTILAVLGVAVFLTAMPSFAKITDNSATFSDPVGDVPAGQPDITSVSVSNDAKGVITFVIHVPNRPTSDPDISMYVQLDTDDREGFDHAFLIEDPTVSTGLRIGIIDEGGRFHDFSYSGGWDTISSWSNGVVIARFDGRMLAAFDGSDLEALGSGESRAARSWPPSKMIFDVRSATWSGRRYLTDDVTAAWSYEVRIFRDLILKSSTVPKLVRAGKPLTVSITAVRDDTGALAMGKPACRAKVGKKDLPRWNPPVAAGASQPSATCSWLVPKTAKGKVVQGGITLTDASGLHPVSESKQFSVKVK